MLDDRPAFGCLVGQGCEQRSAGELNFKHPSDGQELVCLPVAVGNGAGLVEQECGAVASGLDGTSRHGEDVALHQSVHAGDTDGREQGANRRRDEADQ